jgi:hypothetical protein
MGHTNLTLQDTDFFINDMPVYADIEGSDSRVHGLLMNARFIQGIFDDKAAPQRFARFGRDRWDPERQTDDLIAALPEWYACGLRAFTVGLQGGGPVATTPNDTIDNNPFGRDGSDLDAAYAARLDRLVRAADRIGMVVIVSFLYQGQAWRLKGAREILQAVRTACGFLQQQAYTNVIVEVANEHSVGRFSEHPLVHSEEGVVALIDLARRESGGLPVGCSGGGGAVSREIAEASDVILVHGNGCNRQTYCNMIRRIRSWDLNKPVVCNEDSPCHSFLDIAVHTHTSWGYYNNMTKQEPPTTWSITPGEDAFFARRLATAVGINLPNLPFEEQFYLQGLEPNTDWNGQRWIRLASLYPERIDHVDFYCNDKWIDRAYGEPFLMFNRTTWLQDPWTVRPQDRWKAVVHLTDGQTIEKSAPGEKS